MAWGFVVELARGAEVKRRGAEVAGSRVAKPGAYGTTPIILGHASSISVASMGVKITATAPAEWEACLAASNLDLEQTNTILA